MNLLHFESNHTLLGHLLTCVTRGKNSPNQPSFLMFLYVLENMLSQVLLHNQDSTDPTIKRLSHLLHREVSLSVKPAKDFRNLPAESIWKLLKFVHWSALLVSTNVHYSSFIISWQWYIARADRLILAILTIPSMQETDTTSSQLYRCSLARGVMICVIQVFSRLSNENM